MHKACAGIFLGVDNTNALLLNTLLSSLSTHTQLYPGFCVLQQQEKHVMHTTGLLIKIIKPKEWNKGCIVNPVFNSVKPKGLSPTGYTLKSACICNIHIYKRNISICTSRMKFDNSSHFPFLIAFHGLQIFKSYYVCITYNCFTETLFSLLVHLQLS